MEQIVRLENGRNEWILKGGYDSTEIFEPESFNLGEPVHFLLYANGESSMPHHYKMIPYVGNDFQTVLFRDETNAQTKIIAKKNGDLTWTFKLYFDGVETMPSLQNIVGRLNNLLDNVIEKTGYAVCLEGKMAGRILTITPHSIGWFLNWEHSGERAEHVLDTAFALIADPDVFISAKAPLRDAKSVSYEIGVLMAQLHVAEDVDRAVDQLSSLISGIGDFNLIRDSMLDGFSTEFNYGKDKMLTLAKFEESLEMLNLSDCLI